MKHFSKTALLALAIGLVAAVLFSMHGLTVKAQESTASTNNTQVTLVCTSFPNIINSYPSCSQLVSRNGAYYTPPVGQTFVLTDMECVTKTDSPGEIGTCGLFIAAIFPESEGPTQNVLIAGSLSGPHNLSVIGIHLTTGIPLGANLMVSYFASGTPQSISVQGYLVPTSSLSGGS
jgi:hypothetical protein